MKQQLFHFTLRIRTYVVARTANLRCQATQGSTDEWEVADINLGLKLVNEACENMTTIGIGPCAGRYFVNQAAQCAKCTSHRSFAPSAHHVGPKSNCADSTASVSLGSLRHYKGPVRGEDA